MKSLFRIGLSVAALSFLFAACGESEQTQDLGDPRGRLMVAAKSLSAMDEVVRVQVKLSDAEHSVELELTRDESEVWRGEAENLYVGEYDVEAYAYDENDELLFRAAPEQKVLVKKDETTALTIYLTEVREDGELEFPRFVMIALDKEVVEQWETLTITVEMVGGEAPYQISGVNAVNPPDWNVPGTFQNGQFDGNVGTIEWVPPAHSGPKWFKVVVEDARGNTAEVGIDVTVGSDIGSASVNAEFILAPITEITGRILNDNEGTSAYLFVSTSGEGWTSAIDYKWEHGTCNGSFEAQGLPASGTFTPPAPTSGWYFKYQIDRPLLDPPQTTHAGTPAGDPKGIGVCTISLETTGDHGVTYVKELKINTEWVQPGGGDS